MARNCCGEGRCYCAVEGGAGIDVEGTGGADNPYVITATGSGGGGPIDEGDIPASIARDTEVAAAVAAHVDDATDAHDASAISFVPTGTIGSTNVQDAIAEVASEGGSGPVAAEDVTFTPVGTIAATDVQAALAEVAAEGGGHTAHRVYTSPGGAPGYDTLIDLDYNATSGSIPESVMIQALDGVGGTLTKAFWINEAGQPRVWTVFKDEPALKLFSYAENGSGNVLTVQDPWNVGNLRWAINGKGQVVLGDSESIGGSVHFIDNLDDPAPLDLPPYTLIIRQGTGGAENLLVNPNFATNVTGWAASADTLAWESGTGQDGDAGFARMTAGGSGNRNIQATNIPCTPGTVLSVEGYCRWNTGTAKQMSVMIRFLDSGGAQLENNIGTLVTPGTGAWSKFESLNADAPASTVNAQIQVRINSAATSDAVDLDNFWVNLGATIDRSAPDAGVVSIWSGASEIVINDGSGSGGGGGTAASTTFSPAGTVAATNVQAAIEEVSGDVTAEAALARNADNLTSGTVPDARISSTIARDSEVTSAVTSGVAAHTGDTTDAHAASAITFTPAGTIAATTVQAAVEEVSGDVDLKRNLRTAANTQTGNYTLVLSDEDKLIDVNSSSPVTISIPTFASVAFTAGARIGVYRRGTGTVTIAGVDGTISIESPDNLLTLPFRYTTVWLRKRTTNTWVIEVDPADVATHAADTTDVHGIVDTAELVTDADLAGAIGGLATVASTGDYSDLTGAPVLPIAKSVTKTSDQGFTNTTMTNDSQLVLNLAPGTYAMELVVAYDATTANDAKFQFTFSGTATCVMTANYPRLAAAPSPATSTHSIDNGTHSLSMSTAFGNNFQNAGGGGAGIPMPMRIMGRVVVTATGNLQLQAAKQANTDTGTDTKILAGSWLEAIEVVNTP